MEVFRIARQKYATALTSSRALNRWNTNGQYVLVHRVSSKPALDFKVTAISISDDDRLIKQILTKDLPADWRTTAAYPVLQKLGAEWYDKKESLVLKVPSAIIIQEYNYLVNTEHPDFKTNVSFIRSEDYFFDLRLF